MTASGSHLPQIPGCTDLVEVGRGGFAVVYRAHQPSFDRTVAVKVVDRKVVGGDMASRFVRECRAIGALSWHPNVVTVHDAGTTPDGDPYLVMAWIERGALADELVGSPLEPRRVLEVGVAIGGALEASHRAGRLHRDVKPENILVGPMGTPQLADFGIAAVTGQTITTDGSTAFSPLHVPPEVIDGQPATPVSDVYSLASTLYTLASGRAPFEKDTDASLMAMLARIATESPPALPPSVPLLVQDTIVRALAKDPADRPGSAGEFARQLQVVAADLGWSVAPPVIGSDTGASDTVVVATPAKPAPRPEDPEPARGRSKRWLALRVAVGALLLGLAVMMVLDSQDPEAEVGDPASTTTGGPSQTTGASTAGGDAEALLSQVPAGFESRPGSEQFREEARSGAQRVDPEGEIISSVATVQLLRAGEPVAAAIAYGLTSEATNPLVVRDRIVGAALDPGVEKQGDAPPMWRGQVTGTGGEITVAAAVLLGDVVVMVLATDPAALDPLVDGYAALDPSR